MSTDLADLKSRLDIVDVIQSYVPSLKRAGHNYKGLCPFHHEKTPSFMVNPDIQIFKCFGCGEGGDVFSFLQKMERLEFPEAIRLAAERIGYQLSDNFSKGNSEAEREKKQILEANKLAAQFWHYLLETHPAGKAGRDYATSRGLRHEEIVKFQLGYAPVGDNLVKFLTKKGYDPRKLVTWGLAVERNGQVTDKFRDRLVLPVMDARGQVLGFSGRIVASNDYAPKYLNSPETAAYYKGRVLIGIFQAKEAARQSKSLILQEGNMDLLTSHKAGVENIVAVGGTAITTDQCKLISRYADRVLFAFDTDAAGHKALWKAIEICEQSGLPHQTIDLGTFKDPDDMIQTDPKLWVDAVANPRNSVEYVLRICEAQHDLLKPDGKSEFTKQAVTLLRLIKDAVQVTHFAEQVALKVGVGQNVVLDMVNGKTPTPTTRPSAPSSKSDEPGGEQAPIRREVYMLALLMEATQFDLNNIDPEIFSEESTREVVRQLAAFPENSRNYSQLADHLSPAAREVLQEALILDLSHLSSNLEHEILRMQQLLTANQYKTKIWELRAKLNAEPDNDQFLEQLQTYTQHLQKSQS